MSDRLCCGERLTKLNIVYESTPDSLVIEVDTSLPAGGLSVFYPG